MLMSASDPGPEYVCIGGEYHSLLLGHYSTLVEALKQAKIRLDQCCAAL